jgi:hypothetical protein
MKELTERPRQSMQLLPFDRSCELAIRNAEPRSLAAVNQSLVTLFWASAAKAMEDASPRDHQGVNRLPMRVLAILNTVNAITPSDASIEAAIATGNRNHGQE